jgi:hypothetical protein
MVATLHKKIFNLNSKVQFSVSVYYLLLTATMMTLFPKEISVIFKFYSPKQVAFLNFYSVSSAVDKCTMYCDRNLVNRRNVKGDVSAAANPCRRFFQMEIETRVVAATMTVLGMTKIDDKPSANEFRNGSDKEKKAYLHKIASLVVDTYVIDQERNRSLEEYVQNMHHEGKQMLMVDSHVDLQGVPNHLHTMEKYGKIMKPSTIHQFRLMKPQFMCLTHHPKMLMMITKGMICLHIRKHC